MSLDVFIAAYLTQAARAGFPVNPGTVRAALATFRVALARDFRALIRGAVTVGKNFPPLRPSERKNYG